MLPILDKVGVDRSQRAQPADEARRQAAQAYGGRPPAVAASSKR